jgi:regulatory protein
VPARSARAAAVALVSRRDYTTAELASKLKEKGYDAAAIADALADMQAGRFLDDRRVAAAHVRTAAAIKGRGRVRIARELAARGIARELIDAALAGVEAGDELAAIRRILTRKHWPAKPTMAERQRMFRHLLGRGFPGSVIGKALGGRIDEDDDR